MPQVQLTDSIFEAARLRANDTGYSSVDEYIADVINNDLHEDVVNLDSLFTPERLARVDAAAEQIRSGHFYTSEQADVELANRKAEWIRKNTR